MIFDGSGSSNAYRNSPHQKMLNADLILYVNNDGTMEIGKSRYGGIIGLIDCSQRVNLLIQLLVGTAYNNTCEIFQEALRRDLYKVLKKHKVLEGE